MRLQIGAIGVGKSRKSGREAFFRALMVGQRRRANREVHWRYHGPAPKQRGATDPGVDSDGMEIRIGGN
jgi:intein/homing endonuclease